MMNNNDILKKLRVALQLRDDQIVEILELVDFRISKGEIGNFFRAEDHPKYVECGDQILRNFLNGLVIYLRGTKENPKNAMDVLKKNKEDIAKNKSENTVSKENKSVEKKSFVKSFKKPTENKPKPISKFTYKTNKKK